MADLEDKEGEVSSFTPVHSPFMTFRRQLCIRQLSTGIFLSFFICFRIEQTFTLKMLMDGLPCTTRVQRYDPRKWNILLAYIHLQGYLDIVRCICEQGGADADHDGVRGVDSQSKGGWTPLSEYSPFR